jgi:transcriptional pleiotropic regulator of transition state genes
MKSTGIIRHIDELGRMVVPKELRRKLDIADGDPVEIFSEGDRIVMVKYQPNCLFCGSAAELKEFKGKQICASCIASLTEK